MDLPQLITGQSNTRTANRPEASQFKEGQAPNHEELGLEHGNEKTITTPLGTLRRKNTVEIGNPHPSAISGRQEVQHEGIEVEQDQSLTKIPVGLYRMAFDSPLPESQNEESLTEEFTQSKLGIPDSDTKELTPETFLSGIGSQSEQEEVEQAGVHSQAPEVHESASSQEVEQYAQAVNQHEKEPHQIPFQPEHTHFQADSSAQESHEALKANHSNVPDDTGLDSADYLAHLQAERERAQAEILGVQ